jgi:hypothetical protein
MTSYEPVSVTFKLVFKYPNDELVHTSCVRSYKYHKNTPMIVMMRDVIDKAYNDFGIDNNYILEIVKYGQQTETITAEEGFPVDECDYDKTIIQFCNNNINDLAFYIRANIIDQRILK